uniref:non-specific serine/threonine protein kinase n=2 Tax=Cucumis TaxID=3655 RepID=A0A9I9DB12_CUCME
MLKLMELMVLFTEETMMAMMLQTILVIIDHLFLIRYGAVFRGNHSVLMSNLSAKQLKVLDWGEDGVSSVAEIAALRTSFRQEVAVWHKLDHPNVAKFYGASMGTSNLKIPPKSSSFDSNQTFPSRACCVVVEYLPGGTLKSFLIKNRKRKLAFKVVIQLALDLSRGLSYLHSKKIVHRDIKTENVLLDAQKTLKIVDFGVARVEAQNPKDMTGETGTLGYMAPEVLDGKPYNRKCDVYSLGICLWETYCCDMPYPDLSFAEVSTAVVRQNLRPEIPRCCPSSFANIMKRCWDANPEKRPDMDEVVKLLEAIDTSKGGGMITDDQISCFCFRPARDGSEKSLSQMIHHDTHWFIQYISQGHGFGTLQNRYFTPSKRVQKKQLLLSIMNERIQGHTKPPTRISSTKEKVSI